MIGGRPRACKICEISGLISENSHNGKTGACPVTPLELSFILEVKLNFVDFEVTPLPHAQLDLGMPKYQIITSCDILVLVKIILDNIIKI